MPESERLEAYVGSDWQESAAVVYYNMPRERVRHVLYGGKLYKALTEADRSLIKDLLENPGVDLVVEDLLDKHVPEWAKSEPHLIGSAAYALGEQDATSHPFLAKAINRLLKGAWRVSAWRGLNAKCGEGFGILIKVAGDKDFTGALLDSLGILSPSPSPAQAVHAEVTSSWLGEILDILLEAISKPLVAH